MLLLGFFMVSCGCIPVKWAFFVNYYNFIIQSADSVV